jgi:hypothetical protein
MNRSYLLLRNNQQTGPYTLQELKQFQLDTTDFIWIEGISVAWIKPAELERIPTPEYSAGLVPKEDSRQSDSFSKQAAIQNKVYVRMPEVNPQVSAHNQHSEKEDKNKTSTVFQGMSSSQPQSPQHKMNPSDGDQSIASVRKSKVNSKKIATVAYLLILGAIAFGYWYFTASPEKVETSAEQPVSSTTLAITDQDTLSSPVAENNQPEKQEETQISKWSAAQNHTSQKVHQGQPRVHR